MAHQPKKFDFKGLVGISENQISQHRDILYLGYVNKLNEIEERLKTVDITKANQIYSDLRGLKSDETFALNGVVLHELYFENLGGKGNRPKGKLADLIATEFGSHERLEDNLKACGMAARGWVILGLCAYDGKLHNYCLDSHNSNFPANTIPILVMDVYEHAYVIDYGVKRPPYIDAFIKNIDWSVAERRLEKIDLASIAKIAAS
ncbi:MAG: superoxide dismutase [Deltaproteobacteria bacterium RIFCSPLOWO2_02_FULL_53_8]|nr:MAG: superoxide dismutase [Deltaproteobacteria bacterium RIFCSPLOWO2_02_FULL_53_8]